MLTSAAHRVRHVSRYNAPHLQVTLHGPATCARVSAAADPVCNKESRLYVQAQPEIWGRGEAWLCAGVGLWQCRSRTLEAQSCFAVSSYLHNYLAAPVMHITSCKQPNK